MASRHLSVRLSEDALDHLDAESRRSGASRSELAKTLIEEGLRMREHPGIVFRNGAVGRRPALADGPQVWHVARVLRDVQVPPEKVIEETAALTDLSVHQVQIVASYYAEYKDEIDDWIARNDEEAERAHAAWLREQAVLNR